METEKKEFDKNSKFHKGIRAIFKRVFEILRTNRTKYISDFADEIEKDCVNKLTTISLLETYKIKLQGMIINGGKYDEIKRLLNQRYEHLTSKSILNEVFNFDTLDDIEPTFKELTELLITLEEKLSQVGQTKKALEEKQSKENTWNTAVTSYKSEIARIGGSEDTSQCPAKTINQEEIITSCPPNRTERLKLYGKIHPDKNAACPKTSTAMFKLIDGPCHDTQVMSGSGIVNGGSKNEQNNKKQIKDNIFVFF